MSTVDKLLKFKEAGIKLELPKYSNSVEIFVKGDYNDADYVSETQFVSVGEFVEIYPILHKILDYKKLHRHNWEKRSKYLREEEIELIDGYNSLIPTTDYDELGIHTIEQIKCYFRCSDGFRYKIVL